LLISDEVHATEEEEEECAREQTRLGSSERDRSGEERRRNETVGNQQRQSVVRSR
jgi:hypothetical protein